MPRKKKVTAELVPAPTLVPWARRPKEPELPWLAFQTLLRQKPRVFHLVLVDGQEQDPDLVRLWRREYEWDLRFAEYDRSLFETREESYWESLKVTAGQAGAEHGIILNGARNLLFRELAKLLEDSKSSKLPIMKIGEFSKLLSETVKLDRLIRDQTTEHTEVQTSADLSRLTPDELRDILRLLAKAEDK